MPFSQGLKIPNSHPLRKGVFGRGSKIRTYDEGVKVLCLTAWRYPCIEFIVFQHNASIIAYFSPNVKKSFKLLCVENAKPQILPFVYRRLCKKRLPRYFRTGSPNLLYLVNGSAEGSNGKLCKLEALLTEGNANNGDAPEKTDQKEAKS